MSEKYGIRYSDPNPECKDRTGAKMMFWVPATESEEEATKYDTRESAQTECDVLRASPETHVCDNCHNEFRNSERKYFVKKIPERACAVSSVNLQ
jgi:hypothetical protein